MRTLCERSVATYALSTHTRFFFPFSTPHVFPAVSPRAIAPRRVALLFLPPLPPPRRPRIICVAEGFEISRAPFPRESRPRSVKPIARGVDNEIAVSSGSLQLRRAELRNYLNINRNIHIEIITQRDTLRNINYFVEITNFALT